MLTFQLQLCQDLIYFSSYLMKKMTMKITKLQSTLSTCTDLKIKLSILILKWKKFRPTSNFAEQLTLNLQKKVQKFWKMSINRLDKEKNWTKSMLIKWRWDNLNLLLDFLRQWQELTAMRLSNHFTWKRSADF